MKVVLKYTFTLAMLTSTLLATTSADICYSNPYTESIGSPSYCNNLGGVNCRNVIPIENISGDNLSDIKVYLQSQGIMDGAVNLTVGVEDDKGSGSVESGVNAGPFNGLGRNVTYILDDMSPSDTRGTYTQSTVGIDLTNKTLYSTYTKNDENYSLVLRPCDDGGGSSDSSYPTGPFNIIEPTTSINDNTDSTDERDSTNYIYTKVISQDFNISLLHLADDNITLTRAYTKDTNVSIDIINTDDNSTIKADIWNHHFTQGEHDSRTEITNLNIDKIIRSARFRINITTTSVCSDTDTPCSNQTSTKEVYSRDTFSIRPYAFVAFGKNQYKRAGEDFNITIKAVNETNANKVGNSDSAGDSKSTVSSISAYDANITDLMISSHFYQPTAPEITQMQTDIGTDHNTSIDGQVSNCPNAGLFTLNNSNLFNNGEVNASLKFTETGILDLNISEKSGSEWAKVDEDDTNDTQRYIKPSLVTYNEDDINASILQLFVPYKFDTTVESNTTTTKNWLYMYSTNTSSRAHQMSTFVKYKITALNKDGAIVHNYTRKCFPDTDEVHAPRVNGLKLNTTFDLFLDMDLNTTQDANISLFTESNTSQALWEVNPTKSLQAGVTTPVREWISPFQFENGRGEAIVYFNIDRNVSKSLNPIQITLVDANTSTSWMTNPGSPAAFNGTTLNKSYNFLYGRAHAPKQRYSVPEDAPYIADIYYEAYCYGVGCDKTLLPSTKHTDDIRWYKNTTHTTGNDGNVSAVTEKGSIGKVTPDSLSNTANPTTVNLPYDGSYGYPYTTTMELNASKWLIYKEDGTANSFQTEYNKASTGWSGKHETSAETNTTGSAKTNRRTMW